MERSLDVGRIVYRPGRVIYTVALKVEDRPGMLQAISAAFASHGINIVNTVVSNPSQSDAASLVFFVDVTGKEKELEKAVGDIRNINGILDVRVSKPLIDGLAVDVFHFPLYIGSERVAILTEMVLKALSRGMREKFGTAGEAYLFYAGMDMGRAFFKKALTEYRFSRRRDALHFVLLELKVAGWGDFEIKSLDEKGGEATIVVRDNIECRGVKSDKPYSALVRGIISGIFSEYLGRLVVARETSCLSLGHNHCEFRVAQPFF